MGPQTGTAPTYGLRGEAMDWYALRDRVVDRLRSRGRVGSVALYRTQAKVRQSCYALWGHHVADMDQAANEGLPAAALFDSLAVSSPFHTGAPVLAPPPEHHVQHDPRRCLGEALALFVMDAQSVATQRGPSRPPAERSRHGQRVAERTRQHARSDRMQQTLWPLSITGLIV